MVHFPILIYSQQRPNLEPNHATLLDLDVNQHVTVVTPREYMVGAATYNDDPPLPHNNEGVSQLGLVPLSRLLDRRVACPITV